jgi:hypothetical protein
VEHAHRELIVLVVLSLILLLLIELIGWTPPPAERGTPTSAASWSSARDELAVPGDGDRFEPGVDAKRPHQVADVVSNRLEAQVELLGDLCGRMASIQQVQHLGLPGSQVRMQRRFGLCFDVDDLPEDADDVAARVERHRAELDLDTIALRVDEDALYIGHLGAPDNLLREHLARVTSLFRSAHGRVLPPTYITDNSLAGRINPADDPVLVDHIGGHVDRLESAFDIGAEHT